MERTAAGRAGRGRSLAIVGGGVAGLSLARAAAARGLEVVLLDRASGLGLDRPPDAGASALPVALLNPWRGRKGAAHPDDLRGLAATWRLVAELEREGLDPGAHRTGVLRIPADARRADAWRRRAGEAAALEWLEPAPPDLHAPHGALRVRDGGLVEPRRLLAALADAAVRRGARTVLDATVARAVRRPDRPWTLLDPSGDELASADLVALCVGADASPAVDAAGAAPPAPATERTRGDLVALGADAALPEPIAGGVYAASLPDGATWVGGGHRPAEAEDPAAPERLRAAIARTVPGLAGAAVGPAWSGVRAARPDARPWVAERTEGLWDVGAFAGRGFLCAADVAERLAARLAA